MIIRLFLIFAVLLASMYVGIVLQHDPGYILISSQHWTIESTLWVALMALVLFGIMIYIFCHIVHTVFLLPQHWRQWREQQHHTRTHSKANKGFIAFLEGQWDIAKNNLIPSSADTDTLIMNYLTAAQAADALEEYSLRDQYLKQAHQHYPEAGIAIDLLRVQLQISHQHWNQALSTLEYLKTIKPDHPMMLRYLVQVYQQQANWQALIAILPKVKHSRCFIDADFLQIQQLSYLQYLKNIIPTTDIHTLKQWIHDLPKPLKHDPIIMHHYCKALITLHDDKAAEALLRNCLSTRIHDDLIAVYGHISPEYVRIPFIESLLNTQNDSHTITLCLGRLNMGKTLWGIAQDYLERSIQLKPSQDAYQALGQLLDRLNKPVAACEAYRKGLELGLTQNAKVEADVAFNEGV